MKLFKTSLLVLAATLAFTLFAGAKNVVKASTPLVSSVYDFITTDNGMQGLWATDYFHSTVTITFSNNEREGCYDVVRTDGGTFTSLDGAKSPGGAEGTLIGNGTTGTVSGGITMTICGSLRPSPLPNDTPEDLRDREFASYSEKYFHRYFSEIISESWGNWGWTFTTCNNGTWTDNDRTETAYNQDGPNEIMGDIKGDFVPCVKPTPAPTPTPLSCSGTQHLNADSSRCVDYEFGGPPQGGNSNSVPKVLGASTTAGKVLGASTMAGTGTASENIYLALMGLGTAVTAFGIKSFKNPSKRA